MAPTPESIAMHNFISPPAIIQPDVVEDGRRFVAMTPAQELAAALQLTLQGNSKLRPGQWLGLAHRGQAPARGILGLPVDQMSLGKNPGRRDKHRARVRAIGAGTANHSRDKVAPFERHLDALRAEHAASIGR